MDSEEPMNWLEVITPSGCAVKFSQGRKTLAVITHPRKMIDHYMDTDFQISIELRQCDLTFEQHQEIGNFLRAWVDQARAEHVQIAIPCTNEKVNWAKDGF